MTHIQAIVCLFVLLVVALSMNLMFVKEGFINGTGLGFVGKKLDYHVVPPKNPLNGNMGYVGLQYLGLGRTPKYVVSADDQPLSYGFPSSQTKCI